jgi:transposase-like protein
MSLRIEAETVGNSSPLSILTQWALSVHAFRRNRVPVVKKVIAAALCNSGYSYRDVSSTMGGISHIAARDAYLALVTSLPREVKRYRREVAIDGVDVTVGKGSYHLWLARDVDSGEILTFQASPDASADDGTRFLSVVASQCENKPILKIGYGSNRPRGLINLDLYFTSAPSQPSLSIMTRLGRFFAWSRPESSAA